MVDFEIETVVEQRKKNRKRSRKKKSQPEEQKPKTPVITETEISTPSKKKKSKEKEKKKSHDDEEEVSDYYVKMCPHMFVPRGMEEAHTLEMTKFYTSHEFMSQCKDPFYDSSDIESLSDILKYMDIVSDTDDHMDANYYYGKPRSKWIEALESKGTCDDVSKTSQTK